MENRARLNAEHLTIMMLDLCGYTHISARLNRQTLHELHDVFDGLAMPAIQEHHGIIIKKIGDAFLATFKSPTNALHCATALQNKFRDYDKVNKPRYPLHIKIALHTGEVIVRGGDIYGDAVNITARIEGIAKTNDILFSGSLFTAMNKNEIRANYLGRRKFKGVPIPVKIYRVQPLRMKARNKGSIITRIIIWAIILAAAYFLLKYFL